MMLLNLKLAVFLISIQVLWLVQGQSTLGFILNGVNYPNGSTVLRDDIGEGDAALNCTTDRDDCCRSGDGTRAEFYFPNGSVVDRDTRTPSNSYYRTRFSMFISLNRLPAATQTGKFNCEILDANGTLVNLTINIVNSLPATTASEPTTIPSTTSELAITTEQTTTTELFTSVEPAIVTSTESDTTTDVSTATSTIESMDTTTATSTMTTLPESGANASAVAVAAGGAVAAVAVAILLLVIIIIICFVINRRRWKTHHESAVACVNYSNTSNGCYVNAVDGEFSKKDPKHSEAYKAVVVNQHDSEEREVKLVADKNGSNSADAVASETVSSRPIPISEFGKYVSDLHSNSNQPFIDLYRALDKGEEGHSIAYSSHHDRKHLNRFGNIIVYDDNRIVLKHLPERGSTNEEYINASYIDGFSAPNKFIATQGPLPNTLVDFWHLIWQEHPPTIVMVTNLKEGNRNKCEQYWPDSGQVEFGPFQVIITDQQVFADYTVRTLSVSLGSGRSHKVTQYHFTAWPDHGVPDYATPILAFYKRAKTQHHPSRGPMLVHCSAGVGRTGTFIVIDNILEQIEKEQVVDIPGAITKIRQKRMKMVQTHEQFTFIHDAILESVTCGDTQISATNLRMSIAKLKKKDVQTKLDGFEHQLKILEQVSPNPEELQCTVALSHPDKNRGNKYLPADHLRVVLTGEQPDYIHAVSVNGYKRKKAFIIAQDPMKSTVRNFWKMVYDRKCAVVVMVSDLMEEGQEASAQYWPSSGMAQYGEYTVDLLGEEKLEGFTIREISVLEAKAKKAHKVTQFHITCWTADGCCSNLRSITDVIEEMTKVQIRSGNKPIVVHCNDTVTRSGMFCAIATTIERCKTEGVVDVFQVVKALRVRKPGAVPNVKNYQLIFDATLVYLESFDTYANFQNI